MMLQVNCLLSQQLAWNVETYFLQKNKKNVTQLLSIILNIQTAKSLDWLQSPVTKYLLL